MEEKDLELGDWEATWTLSGSDILKAVIRVTDTGVTCLSVTAGSCNSARPPGVMISAFTVTAHLKSAGAPPTPPDVAKFGLKEIVENHLPEWITGYACAACSGGYKYNCPTGYKRTECRPEPNGSHGCCPRCMVAFVKCEQEGVAPPTKGYLKVNTSPTGALVTADIVFPCGTTPVTKCELDTGTKTVKITKSGYNTVTRSVTITAGATTDLGTITLTPTAAPPAEIGSWIDESGVTNLTKNHAVYVFYVSAGAVSAADGKYAKLSPKPSKLDPSLASKDNAIGIFYYSQGAMAAGNGKTGCNY